MYVLGNHSLSLCIMSPHHRSWQHGISLPLMASMKASKKPIMWEEFFSCKLKAFRSTSVSHRRRWSIITHNGIALKSVFCETLSWVKICFAILLLKILASFSLLRGFHLPCHQSFWTTEPSDPWRNYDITMVLLYNCLIQYHKEVPMAFRE